MKKLFFTSLLLLLTGSGSFLFAQGRVVQIQSGSANFNASPPTVTFDVYWYSEPDHNRHRDSVWVFVDYALVADDGSVGAWTPASLTGITVTAGAGSVVTGSPNGRGFYLDGSGYASFLSTLTVTLSPDLNGKKFNWCAYATDYPPNATEGNGAYNLHGTTPFVVNGDALGAGVRTYTGCITSLTDATGCPGFLPVPPAVSNLTATSTAVCPDEPVTLEATATGAAWYSFDEQQSWISANTFTVHPTSSGTYRVIVKNSAGCTATIEPISVTVHPTPSVTAFAATPDEICVGESIQLTATSGDAVLYSFNNGDSWDTPSTATFAPTQDTVYTLFVKNSAGCTATATPASVTVHALPNPTLSASTTTACPGTVITVTAGGGGSYCFTQSCTACIHNPYLTGNDSNGAADCKVLATQCTSYTLDNTYYVTMPESGIVTVWVRVKNANGCIDSTYIELMVATTPAVPILSGGGTYCAGTVSLTGTSESGNNYQVQNNLLQAEGAVQTGTGLPLSFPVTASGTYTLTATHPTSGCVVTSNSQAVTIYEVFNPGSISGAGTAAIGNGATTNTIGIGTPVSGASGSYTYRWVREGTSGGTYEVNSASYTFTAAEINTTGTYTYYREVHDNTCETATWIRSSGSYVLTVCNCPYTENDLFQNSTHQCQLRADGAKNWEAWIQDTRDSELYRIVLMPDNKWWLAQNLKYTGTGAVVTLNGCTPDKCGRGYTGAEASGNWGGTSGYGANKQGACPAGWVLPVYQNWENTMAAISSNVSVVCQRIRALDSPCGNALDYYGFASIMTWHVDNSTYGACNSWRTNNEERSDWTMHVDCRSTCTSCCNQVQGAYVNNTISTGRRAPIRCYRTL